MFEFECSTCGQVHEGLPALGFEYPEPYFGIPEAERADRAVVTSDTCVLGDRDFMVRAQLEIPIAGADEPLAWALWVSLSAENFARYQEMYEAEGREANGPWFAWLCSRVPFYPDTLLLKTNVHLQPVPMRPLIELEPTDHPLAVDQREGISMDRAREIVESVLHPR